MKTFTFRVTQDLAAFYEGVVEVEASSEKAARNKLAKMTTQEIEEIAHDWEQNTDNAAGVGNITVQDLVSEEEEDKDE